MAGADKKTVAVKGKFAVIGQPVGHSKSPQIHQEFARQFGGSVDYSKLPAEPTTFADTLGQFFADGGVGVNITLPFKTTAYALCAKVTEQAEEAKAVNTIWRETDWCGANTDGEGLIKDLVANLGIQISDSAILIIGAGGATRGILGPLHRQAPAKITIANRTLTRAQELARDFSDLTEITSHNMTTLASWSGQPFDLIIQASALGHDGKLPVLSSRLYSPNTVCYDLSYGQAARPFLNWADNAGVRLTSDGIGMLVEQAALSFGLWFGRHPQTGKIITELRQSMLLN